MNLPIPLLDFHLWFFSSRVICNFDFPTCEVPATLYFSRQNISIKNNYLLTLGSRLIERNPLQTVATIKVTKLNHMDGIAKMCKIEMVFNADFFFSDFSCALSSCSLLSTLLFSVKMTYLLIILHIYTLIHTFLYLHK